jgi:hypothetical protein
MSRISFEPSESGLILKGNPVVAIGVDRRGVGDDNGPADAAYPSNEVGRHASTGVVRLGMVTKRSEGKQLAPIL